MLQRARDAAVHESQVLMQARDAERQRAARAEQRINQRTLKLSKQVAQETQRANLAEQEREAHLRRAKRAEAERDAGCVRLFDYYCAEELSDEMLNLFLLTTPLFLFLVKGDEPRTGDAARHHRGATAGRRNEACGACRAGARGAVPERGS